VSWPDVALLVIAGLGVLCAGIAIGIGLERGGER
jgi:hypothetical protein